MSQNIYDNPTFFAGYATLTPLGGRIGWRT